MRVALDQIKIITDADGKPVNPRTRYKTNDLDSIGTLGQLHPLDVRDCGEFYELLDGHRRYQWLQEHGYDSAEVNVVDLGNADPKDYMLATYARQPLKPSQMGRAILDALQRGHTTATLMTLLGLKSQDIEAYAALMSMEPVLIGKADAGMMTISAIRKLVNQPQAVRDRVATSDKPITAGTVRAAMVAETGGGQMDALFDLDSDPTDEPLTLLRQLAIAATPQQAAIMAAKLHTLLLILEGKLA